MPDTTESILIVEDSEFSAQVLRKAVCELADVTIAKTGNAALDLIAAHDFDIILLDIMLPDIDGFEVLRRITQAKPSDAPPVLFVTSRDNIEDEERGLSLGAVDYITKPIVASLVQARVHNHLMLIRARRELSAKNTELQLLAATDPLTGVYNRRYFYEHVEKERKRAARYEQSYALITLDLDHFKSINDNFGHDRGDRVLTAVAEAWTRTLRTNDILGRIGGEEFSIFLPQTNKQQAAVAVERLLKVTRALDIADGKGGALEITASIGVALPTQKCRQPLSICADKAMYAAKTGGRDRAVTCCWAAHCREQPQ